MVQKWRLQIDFGTSFAKMKAVNKFWDKIHSNGDCKWMLQIDFGTIIVKIETTSRLWDNFFNK